MGRAKAQSVNQKSMLIPLVSLWHDAGKFGIINVEGDRLVSELAPLFLINHSSVHGVWEGL